MARWMIVSCDWLFMDTSCFRRPRFHPRRHSTLIWIKEIDETSRHGTGKDGFSVERRSAAKINPAAMQIEMFRHGYLANGWLVLPPDPFH
jgi:hypothetical protein